MDILLMYLKFLQLKFFYLYFTFIYYILNILLSYLINLLYYN